MEEVLTTKDCTYRDTVTAGMCGEEAEYNVIGETVSCFFSIERAKDPAKAEFCMAHAELVRNRRQAQTPAK